ncbi:MAG: tetratricopeptide repeat protein [Bacteroidota bacterium]
MATPSNWETQMERYLNRQMSDEEHRRFETEINDDPLKYKALQERMQAELAVLLSAREAEVNSLKARFQAGSGKVRNFNYGYLAAAAAVLLLIGLAVILRPKPEFDSQALFAANYQAPAAPQARGDNGLDSLLQVANNLYNQKAYQEAIPLYQDYIEQNPDVPNKQADLQNARLFVAIALLENNQLEEAMRQLKQLMEQDEIAQWYLALALLKKGEITASKEVLEMIKGRERHLYQARAAKILELYP